MGLDLRDLLREHLVVHPRIAAQAQIVEATRGARLAAELPPLVPFGSAEYVGGDWILDWDHRLPSRSSAGCRPTRRTRPSSRWAAPLPSFASSASGAARSRPAPPTSSSASYA